MRVEGRVTAAALLVLIAGCGADAPQGPLASSSPAAASASPAPSPAAGAATADCPPVPAGRSAFPAGMPADFPADFPAPPGAADAVGAEDDPAVVNVRFPSPLPLREATAFVVRELPVSGYEVVGGDREPHEADVVFARGALRGQLRIARVDDCTTYWLVQVVRPG